jgi:uncharacterized membrane protein YkvA (DUF1232 family)
VHHYGGIDEHGVASRDLRRHTRRLMSRMEHLKRRAQELKREIAALFLAIRHPRTPWYAKLLLLAIVAYALSPIDLIPDFVPVIGLLDDVLLLPLAIALVLKMIPASVIAECRERAVLNEMDRRRVGRFGAIGVLLLWLALLILAALWAYPAFAQSARDAGAPVAAAGAACPCATIQS